VWFDRLTTNGFCERDLPQPFGVSLSNPSPQALVQTRGVWFDRLTTNGCRERNPPKPFGVSLSNPPPQAFAGNRRILAPSPLSFSSMFS
jgi:hypothetical protein